MNEADIVDAWEKRVGPETAHIEAGKFLKLAALNDMFQRSLKWVDLPGKTLIDYGCGGGFLGEYLFNNDSGIKKYIGMDIANRSLIAARGRLDKIVNEDKAFFIKIDPKGIKNLDSLKADILTCFNVVQHFPDKEYFNYFFEQLEKSGIPEIVLNVRYGETRFQVQPYKTTHEINLANWTNSGDVLKLLPSYDLIKKSHRKGQKFEYMYFKLKEEKPEND